MFIRQLGAPHSKSQNQWTGVEYRALYLAERQGTQGRILQVDHPPPYTPTPTIQEPRFTSDVKVILLNDHHVQEVGIVSKGKD